MRALIPFLFSGAVFSFSGSLFGSICLAEENGLPFESDLIPVKLPPVGIGHHLDLIFTLTIPETQKLNHGAPSNVTIFEKAKTEKVWTATKVINLNEKLLLENKMSFQEGIELNSDDSEIVVHATAYHCGRKDSKVPCFIQGFQGFIKRNKKSNSHSVVFKAAGTVY